MNNTKKLDISLLFEKYYPLFFGLIISIIYYGSDIKLIDDVGLILNAVISFSSVIVGFLGILLTLIFSLKDNPLVDFIFDDEHYKKLIKGYFEFAIKSGFITILLTIIMFLNKTICGIHCSILSIESVMKAIKAIFVFFAVCFPLSSYRVISTILKIAFRDEPLDQSEEEEENEEVTEYAIQEMNKRIALDEEDKE